MRKNRENEKRKWIEQSIRITTKTQKVITEYFSKNKQSDGYIEEADTWGDNHNTKRGCRIIFNNINGMNPKENRLSQPLNLMNNSRKGQIALYS